MTTATQPRKRVRNRKGATSSVTPRRLARKPMGPFEDALALGLDQGAFDSLMICRAGWWVDTERTPSIAEARAIYEAVQRARREMDVHTARDVTVARALLDREDVVLALLGLEADDAA